jgi:HAD superfamily hydrolase (TIGR01549 family)
MTLKAIFFDHDDTLVGTIQAKWAQHKHVAKTFYNKTITDDQLRAHWGRSLGSIMQALYETDDMDQAFVYNTAHRTQFPKQLFTGTLETLTTLRTTHLRIGLVTGSTRSNLLHDFETLGISSSLFDYLQTEDDTPVHKPDPQVFTPTLNWLSTQNILPHEVLYVGDHLNDLLAARGAGFHFIGVATGLITLEEFEKHTATAIPHLPSLLDFLKVTSYK